MTPTAVAASDVRRDENAVDVRMAIEQGSHRVAGECRAVVAGDTIATCY